MTHLTVIGNFQEFMGKQDDGMMTGDTLYGGLRNTSITNGIAYELSKYFDISTIDITNAPLFGHPDTTPGLSNILGSPSEGGWYLYINNARSWKVDLPINVIYWHIDGLVNVHPNQAAFGLRFHNGEPYQVHDHHINILPFVNTEVFNPHRKKDILISHISRTIPFDEYRDLLERSKFVMSPDHWLSKRMFEAMACRTIPIIVAEPRWLPFYRLAGFRDDFSLIIGADLPWNESQWESILIKERDYYDMADKAYKFILRYHTLEKRMKYVAMKMKQYIKKYKRY